MKKLPPFLIALCAAASLSMGAASSSFAQETEPTTAAKKLDDTPAEKKSHTPHNHMRDAKGIPIPAKQSQTKEGAKSSADASDALPDADTKKTISPKKKLRPHSHPQDAKGIYVPEKK